VATRGQENAEGEETAREAVAATQPEREKYRNGSATVRLWRGAKGCERTTRESNISWALKRQRPQRSAEKAKIKEGAKKTDTFASLFRIDTLRA
jgi:hypothetical protein